MKLVQLIAVALVSTISQQIASAQNVSSKLDEKSGLYGFVDENDKYVVKPIYKEVDFNFGYKPGLSKVINSAGKAGFVNEQGKEVVKCSYDEVDGFDRGYAIIKIKTGEYTYKNGLLDSTGKVIIAPKYERMEYYPSDAVLIVGDENASNVGVMDLTGKMIIAPQYEFWSKRISKGIWPVGKNNICGVVNLKNEVIVPFTYEMIESYSDEIDVAPAKKDGKFGCIDRKGTVVIPFLYNDAWPSGPYIVARKDKKWGVITTDNKIILPFDYESISSVDKKSAWVTKVENETSYEIDMATKQKVTKK